MKCENIKCNKEHDGSFGSGKYCSRACANSRNHSDETRLKQSFSAKKSEKVRIANKINSLKPKSNVKNKKILNKCLYCNLEIKTTEKRNQKYHHKCYLKCAGGERYGSGRSKCGWYKNYYCGSSYELAYVIYNLEHNIKIKRNKESFKYIYNGKEHLYYPDFIVNNIIIEIKGFKIDVDNYKWASVNKPFKVIFKEELKKEILPYVINKYGKDFIKLYEDVV